MGDPGATPREGSLFPTTRRLRSGISPYTVQRGLAELADHGLLDVDERFKKAALSETGWTTEYRYTLQPPFGPLRQAGATVTKLHA